MIILLVIMGVLLGKDNAAVTYVFDVLKDVVNPPFMIIVGFYFLAQVAGKARGK